MDRTIAVRTPESAEFTQDVAGLGSRFLALALDTAIQCAILAAILWGLTAVAHGARPLPVRQAGLGESLGIALLAFTLFTVFFGYYIVLEGLWNGTTPGKRALGIRVVRDGGYPLDWSGALVRNVVRVAEAAACAYAASAVAVLVTNEGKRFGDMAAGTVVVRERNTLRAVDVASIADGPVPGMLSRDELDVIGGYLARSASLDPEARARIAARIAERVRPRVSYDLQRLDDETLLERIGRP